MIVTQSKIEDKHSKLLKKNDITFGSIVNPDICMLHAEMNV